MTVVFCSHQISHRTCAFVSDHEIPRLVLLFLILFLFFSLLVSHLPFHFLNLFPSHQISHRTCAFVSDHEIKRCSIIEALADWWARRSGTFPDLLFLPQTFCSSCQAVSNICCLKHFALPAKLSQTFAPPDPWTKISAPDHFFVPCLSKWRKESLKHQICCSYNTDQKQTSEM